MRQTLTALLLLATLAGAAQNVKKMQRQIDSLNIEVGGLAMMLEQLDTLANQSLRTVELSNQNDAKLLDLLQQQKRINDRTETRLIILEEQVRELRQNPVIYIDDDRHELWVKTPSGNWNIFIRKL